MASSAVKWFYQTPEHNSYLLQERVNGNLWMARFTDVYFVTERAESPFQMSAPWREHRLLITWEPGQWLRLQTVGSAAEVVTALSNILQLQAVITYTDHDGNTIHEWHVDGGETRWRDIQGNPLYQSPLRLSR
ncbi:MAG: hypothetical protein JW910_05755 [Anaerolineae bacterium]|nr:hypothetical protein [Anaerolineae bacterium]